MAEKIGQKQNFLKGIIKENPVFVMLLGMCPTLGVTSSAFNGLGMGVATLFVLLMSNIVVSLVKSQIPNKVRIPAFIIIIASFVTIVEMVLEAFIPFYVVLIEILLNTTVK
jgi:electron transport complex protein RnfE